MNYPNRLELEVFREDFDRYSKNKKLFTSDYKKRLLVFMETYGEYVLSLLESDLLHTEPTEEATAPTLRDVALTQNKKKLFWRGW